MPSLKSTLSLALIMVSACQPDTLSTDQNDVLAFMEQHLDGAYNNQMQMAAEVAVDAPDSERHDPAYQSFQRVVMPNLEGLTYLLRASSDGTEATRLISGVYHATPDPDSEAVLLRLKRLPADLMAQDVWTNPDLLRPLTNDDLTWTEGCAFYLTYNKANDRIEGAMKENACYFDRGDGSKMAHHDAFVLSATELWSNGRFYDAEGNFLFGNAAGSPVVLTKQNEP